MTNTTLELGVCGSTRTRGYTRPDPYPRVRDYGSDRVDVSRVGSTTGTKSTGTGIPGFTRKEHDFGAITFLFLHDF